MFIGLNENKERVYITDAKKEPDKLYLCPMCMGKLKIRDGKVNASHFAHISLDECDTFTSDMSEWHRRWQACFPLKNQEVILENNDIKHRADVLACGYVIEFQHSRISRIEFNERNMFYNACGYKVIWIFDTIELFLNHSIVRKFEPYEYSWSHPWRFMSDYNPQRKRNIIVAFQTSDTSSKDTFLNCFLEKVIWTKQKNYNKESDFSSFNTSMLANSISEFINRIKERSI